MQIVYEQYEIIAKNSIIVNIEGYIDGTYTLREALDLKRKLKEAGCSVSLEDSKSIIFKTSIRKPTEEDKQNQRDITPKTDKDGNPIESVAYPDPAADRLEFIKKVVADFKTTAKVDSFPQGGIATKENKGK